MQTRHPKKYREQRNNTQSKCRRAKAKAKAKRKKKISHEIRREINRQILMKALCVYYSDKPYFMDDETLAEEVKKRKGLG